MSSITWTPSAVASKQTLQNVLRSSLRSKTLTTGLQNFPQSQDYSLRLWRAVEAQHVAATTRLVDSLAEQEVLEDLLEASKPAVPPAAARLHYLLATPFRYPSPYGSRFRAPTDPGVYYGADERRTACAEVGFWRWRFLMDSEGLKTRVLGPAAQTVFAATIRTRGIDLRELPFVRDHKRWTHKSDYSATQAIARDAHAKGLGAIRYQSVRDPGSGACTAVLLPEAFASKRPTTQQTWFLTLTAQRASWRRDSERFDFSSADW